MVLPKAVSQLSLQSVLSGLLFEFGSDLVERLGHWAQLGGHL